jgi:hypothetical protein
MKVNKERQLRTMEDETMENEFDSNRLVGIDMSNPLEAIKAIVAEQGFTYEWQRYKLRDKQDSAYAFAISRGWKPIDKTKIPAKYNLDVYEVYNPDPIAQKYICHGDLILMKRENALHEQEKYTRADIARKSVEMADSFNYDSANPTLNVMKNN